MRLGGIPATVLAALAAILILLLPIKLSAGPPGHASVRPIRSNPVPGAMPPP